MRRTFVRKRLNLMRNSVRRYGRLSVAALVAMVLLAVGAITVISRQKSVVKEESHAQAARPVANSAAPAAKSYVTVKVAGHDVQIDGQTGQIKPLTQEEAQKLAASLRQEINQSTDGLVQVKEPDGSVSMDLQGRFQNVTVARVNDDGTISEGCVDNAQAAAAFFGIDPQLIDSKATSTVTGQRRLPTTVQPSNK